MQSLDKQIPQVPHLAAVGELLQRRTRFDRQAERIILYGWGSACTWGSCSSCIAAKDSETVPDARRSCFLTACITRFSLAAFLRLLLLVPCKRPIEQPVQQASMLRATMTSQHMQFNPSSNPKQKRAKKGMNATRTRLPELSYTGLVALLAYQEDHHVTTELGAPMPERKAVQVCHQRLENNRR